MEAQVETWVRLRIDGLVEFSLTDITNDAVAEFDETFLTELAKEHIRSTVHRIAQKEVAKTRPNRPRLVRHGDTVVDLTTLRRRLETSDRTWGKWMEYVGDRHVSVLDMQKVELLAAADIRRQRGEREYHLAGLWVALADRLDDVQKVKDVFQTDEIEKIAAGLRSVLETRVKSWDEVVREAAEVSRRGF